MRQTWDTLRPFIDARRFSEVKAKLASQETDAADWRDTSVNYWKEFSGRANPVDNGPLSIKIVVGGRTVGGFDLSAPSYTIPVAAGTSPTITKVIPADPAVRYEILSQDAGQAVVRVTGKSYFGPIVKDYVFTKVRDTTLKALKVNGRKLSSFSPDVHAYRALLPKAGSEAKVAAVANDPAATVRVDQASEQATVTVTNGGATSIYTVYFDTTIRGRDEFSATQLGSQWRWVRPDSEKWRLSDGSLVITSQSGDLQQGVNTARNVALQDVNGDWTTDSRLVFSRPVAGNNEQGGVIAYADDDNYVKLAWEMSNSTAAVDKRRVVLVREQNGVTTTAQITGSDAQQIVGASGAIWLRLTKSGNAYKAYYSSNGTVYKFLGATTLNTEPTGAGLVAFNRAGTATDLNVAFDYFRIKSHGEPIRQPQTGMAEG